MGSIVLSGLYDKAHAVFVFILGEDTATIRAAADIIALFGQKVRILGTSTDMARMERLTLENMRHHIHERDKVLYMHSKGVSYSLDSAVARNVIWWTLFMEWHLLQGHARCTALLDAYDVVGVKWEEMERADAGRGGHFSGNFWWATGEHLLSLDPVVEAQYHDPELYVGSKQPRHYSLWQIRTKDGRAAVLHDFAYPPRHYVDADMQQRALHIEHTL
jgi:hypothetical protein